jgi:autotransporter strand-loop-strand O-heptosyltransferase
VEEFRKKHNCRVICSSFRNDLFKDTYPDIEFVNPGSVVPDLYAMYTIGWYYFENGNVDFDKNKRDFRTIPLQQTASDFLGIDFSEIKPLISLPQDRGYVLGDYISIAPHASSHAKYWNRAGGWQSLVDWFITKNVNTAMITHEPLGDEWHDSKLGGTLKNLIDRTGDFPLENRINEIKHSKMFIGVSSGLSWLAWALNVPTVIISGFTEEFLEPSSCIRIINKDVCHGCQTKFRLDAGDWEWCPINKNTEDMFICTKEISAEIVIKTIEENFDI